MRQSDAKWNGMKWYFTFRVNRCCVASHLLLTLSGAQTLKNTAWTLNQFISTNVWHLHSSPAVHGLFLALLCNCFRAFFFSFFVESSTRNPGLFMSSWKKSCLFSPSSTNLSQVLQHNWCVLDSGLCHYKERANKQTNKQEIINFFFLLFFFFQTCSHSKEKTREKSQV